MKRESIRLLLMLGGAALAHAHFTFIVPDPGGATAKVIMSEGLKPDQDVDVAMIAGTKLNVRPGSGKDTTLTLAKGDKAFTVTLPGAGTRVVHGLTDLGVMQRGEGKPHVLLYYPKAIVGDAFDSKTVVGGETPVELIPTGKPGAFSLKLVARGKALPDSEITVILPDGSEKKVKTDAAGQTETFAMTGRFGAWARFWETSPGERGGKKYEELRHYATLVFDVHPTASAFGKLPEATSSFGAVESGGFLYVYGGHISPTHNYYDEAVSGRFHRLNLATGAWQQLAGGPRVQGMNLAEHGGKIYRVGGMTPRNKKGAATDNHSSTDVARFDPATGKWEALPALPVARSSHDVVVIGNQLIVTAGWNMKGGTQDWMETLAVLDLSAKTPSWKSVAQPFKRRALIAAAHNEKLYVIGGFDDHEQIVRKVSIWDPRTGAWSEGPMLPEGPGMAFAPAAVSMGGHLYVSLSDGTLLRMAEASGSWEKVGKATGRLAHRLAAYQGQVLSIGGALGGNNFDLIEAVKVR
jgi:hypothetical protein